MTIEIKNLRKAAERILEAVEKKEKVIVFGDSDPDGVGSVIILKETLEDLGLKPVEIYFPNREIEGYGMNESALRYLKKHAPGLLITIDCGIGNVKEAEIAKKMGFEVVIIDHHKVLSEVPNVEIIVDPKQEDDEFPFKEFAAAGLAYKLSQMLFSIAGQEMNVNKFLELASLSTIADMMLMEDENEVIIREGMLALNFTKRLGLLALIDLTDFKNWDIQEVKEKIVSVLNAGETKNHLNEAYLLLIEKDEKKALLRAKKLIEKQEEKREEIDRIVREVEERTDEFSEVIFEGDPSWPLVLLGPSASRLCNFYGKPVFLHKRLDKESPGSVRVPLGLDAVKAMTSCNELLETYGGHPSAAGFRLKNENLEEFKNCLITYFKK
ncbi:MAG: DHH family phosphoesterase [Patescibacteria group bacterium]